MTTTDQTITRADVQTFCTNENSVIDFLMPKWQIGGNKLWSASAHRIAEGTVIVRTMVDDELREWGVLNENGWAKVKAGAGSYDDGNRVLRVADGMRSHAIYGEYAGSNADC